MKSKMIKFAVAVGLLASSAMALAANASCCGDLLCCLQRLACCA